MTVKNSIHCFILTLNPWLQCRPWKFPCNFSIWPLNPPKCKSSSLTSIFLMIISTLFQNSYLISSSKLAPITLSISLAFCYWLIQPFQHELCNWFHFRSTTILKFCLFTDHQNLTFCQGNYTYSLVPWESLGGLFVSSWCSWGC